MLEQLSTFDKQFDVTWVLFVNTDFNLLGFTS